LEATIGGNLVDNTLNDTVYELIVQGHSKRVARIKSDFKIPDRRFWWIKIKALAQIRDWASLENFSKEKKSPIGYAPFAQICIEQNAIKEAEKYISRIQDLAQKVDYYIRIGSWMDAAEVAKTAKDPNLLLTIKNKCNNREIISRIDQILQTFNSK